MNGVTLLSKSWKLKFKDLLNAAKKEILISSPFINDAGVDFLLNSSSKNCMITILTNLSSDNILKNTTNPSAIAKIFNGFKDVRISSLRNLHAKIYIADNTKAIITSANLTNGGIFANFEYGVFFENQDIVQLIKGDLERYFFLGNLIGKEFLDQILKEVEILNVIEKEGRDITKLDTLLNSQAERIDEGLLINRVRGRTINSIFSETILYLLEKHDNGLPTNELNRCIRETHPDICDDTIDREINGQRFGKKWKHLVRGAQQSLKRQGKIILNKDIWSVKK